ncbi:hypothetical protein F4777DRAFT_574868 [Nemania sp. FL0916]|nr:hypothetical protein F4777DRAFT_574868 [Nemania sp. FL0916]
MATPPRRPGQANRANRPQSVSSRVHGAPVAGRRVHETTAPDASLGLAQPQVITPTAEAFAPDAFTFSGLNMNSPTQLASGHPFGYRVPDHSSGQDLLGRPPQRLGNPILEPEDNVFMSDFFSNVGSNQYNTHSYGEGLNFTDQWGAPPLLGHGTSLAHQAQVDPYGIGIREFPFANFDHAFNLAQSTMAPSGYQPPPPPQQQQPSRLQPQPQPVVPLFQGNTPQPFREQRRYHIPTEQDARDGAAALLTSLQSGHSNDKYPPPVPLSSLPSLPSEQATRNHESSFSLPNALHSHDDFSQSSGSNDHTLFTQMIFGSQQSTAQRPAERPALQWGSDTHFDEDQGFVPPRHESSEALERKRVDRTKGVFQLTSSTTNTRASSPIRNEETTTYTTPEHRNRNVKMEENPATPSRKRQKSKAKTEREEDGEDADRLPLIAAARKRKSKGDLNNVSSDPSSATQESSGKRRKSAANQPKPPRENLTDAQKRENHIKSEQKRRGAIKEGFDDLTFIVPNLIMGGFSKSTILNITGEWLDDLIRGNREMDPEGTYAP